MTAIMMSGDPVAEAVLADVGERVAKLAADGRTVGLGTLLVGDDPASAGYVRKKHEMCQQYGLLSFRRELPADATQADVLAAVAAFNAEPAVDAYLIQHPIPAQLDFNAALTAMEADKDADGLHPLSLGKLVLSAPGPVPATPAGVEAMLAHYDVPVAGRNVVIVGRGPTLGRPLALLLSRKAKGANAAVTVVHTGVPDWRDYARRADILVGAAGSPNMITPDVVKPGAAVIGGGITWEGKRLISDVDERCAEVAGWCTTRLRGVGATTIAMLLRNAVDAAERRAASASTEG
jgi:methylenetetrahydrofolate dehydrogenase (NADP+) / methenyltetrahydrofolate cyclohydrolase